MVLDAVRSRRPEYAVAQMLLIWSLDAILGTVSATEIANAEIDVASLLKESASILSNTRKLEMIKSEPKETQAIASIPAAEAAVFRLPLAMTEPTGAFASSEVEKAPELIAVDSATDTSFV